MCDPCDVNKEKAENKQLETQLSFVYLTILGSFPDVGIWKVSTGRRIVREKRLWNAQYIGAYCLLMFIGRRGDCPVHVEFPSYRKKELSTRTEANQVGQANTGTRIHVTHMSCLWGRAMNPLAPIGGRWYLLWCMLVGFFGRWDGAGDVLEQQLLTSIH